MSSNNSKPPAYLDEEVPLPDDEWAGASGPLDDDIPPPDDAWMPGPTEPPPRPPSDLPPPSEMSSRPSSPGSKSASARPTADGGERQFGKGIEVKIIGGKEGVGRVGEIFWWGDSKYGEGMRAGVRGPGDTTYWVDEADLGWPDDEIPEDVLEAVAALPDMGKGDRVRVINGGDQGAEGVIFWWGDSKWGDGMRAGLKTDTDETIWADAVDLEKVDAPAKQADDDIPF